jgi:osmotically-inducible protein OsmY
MTASGLAKVGAGAILGLAIGYLFDPNRGRARRAQLRDQGRARLVREARAIRRRAHYEQGRITGLRHRVGAAPGRPPVDDHTLVDRIRSQTLGRMPELAHHISVDATDGVVTLRGQLDRPSDIERVVDAVADTPGTARVVNLLHLPGEVAANKTDAADVRS